MIYLFDENIPKPLVEILEKAYDRRKVNQFIHLTELFGQGSSDPKWIEDVSKWKDKPLVVTGDNRILKTPVNKAALLQSGLSFVFIPKDFPRMIFESQVWSLITIWDELISKLSEPKEPVIYKIKKVKKPRSLVEFEKEEYNK